MVHLKNHKRKAKRNFKIIFERITNLKFSKQILDYLKSKYQDNEKTKDISGQLD
ncbi:hypothetical protein CR513_56941, partial [Mucuna pruriens]